MQPNRFALATMGLAALVGLGACTGNTTPPESPSLADITILTVAYSGAEDDPQGTALSAFGDSVAEATNGRVTLNLQAQGVLGGQDGVVTGVSAGTVDLAVVSSAALEPFNEDFGLFALPYVFSSPEAQASALADDTITSGLFTSLEEPRTINVLTGLYGGTRSVYNTAHPIIAPADMDGLRIRVDSSQATVSMIQEMGAIAVPLALAEVDDGLANGAVDGAENTPTTYLALGHEEKATFFSFTRHLMVPDVLIVNTDRLDALAAQDRTAILDLVPALREQANTAMTSREQEARTQAESAGASFNDDVDTAAFAERTAAQREDFLTNPVRTSIYDVIQRENDAYPGP